MNCAECGKEIVDETSSFCAYCGNSFDVKKNKLELLGSAAILLVIAATFAATLGVIGLLNYQAYVAAAPLTYAQNVNYFMSIGVFSEAEYLATFLGFLIFGIINIVAFIPGLIGGFFALFKKRYRFSLISSIIVLCSSLTTFIIIWYYGYGYADIVLMSEIPMLVFSFLSIFLIKKSKKDFV